MKKLSYLVKYCQKQQNELGLTIQFKSIVAVSCLIVFLCFSSNVSAIDTSNIVSGPGWHVTKERTTWPDNVKGKYQKKAKKAGHSKTSTNGPLVYKGKRIKTKSK